MHKARRKHDVMLMLCKVNCTEYQQLADSGEGSEEDEVLEADIEDFGDEQKLNQQH